jgi:hypothetical protein
MKDSDFLRYIYQNKHGLRADLVDKFDDRTVRQMEATGIIVNAPSNHGTTWKMSKMAEEIASLKFKKLSFSEKFMEWYYSHVRKISLSVG